MWQAEADTELTLSASPSIAVGQKALAMAKRCYSTVECFMASFQLSGLDIKAIFEMVKNDGNIGGNHGRVI